MESAEKWRAMCQEVMKLSKDERYLDTLLPHELKLYEEGRLDLVIQSIRERQLCTFARAADIYRDWKSSQAKIQT